VHLLRADIVDCDYEDALVSIPRSAMLDCALVSKDIYVLLEQRLQLVEVGRLVAGLAPHVFLVMKIGYLRVKCLMSK